MKLYIIGNGFDLNHGLRTSYENYKSFLYSKRVNIKEFEDFEYFPNHIGDDWSDIENHLELNYVELMYDTVRTYYPNLDDDSDSRWCNISIDINLKTALINKIINAFFYEWLNTIELKCDKHFHFDSDDCFITFNYTRTLEDVYEIHPLHVHGILGERIQFGCFENNPLESFKKLEKEYSSDEWYGASIEQAVYAVKNYCEQTYKDYEANKKRIECFLNGKSIDEVIVMGHSFAGIDERYYKDVFSKFKCKWIIYCHKEKDFENAENLSSKYNINVEVVKW